MRTWKLMMLCSAVSMAACQAQNEPPTWSDLQGVPDGFKDGQDDVRTEADVRAIARAEATLVAQELESRPEQDPTFAASAASTLSTEDVTNWDTAFGWGDHAGAGYLQAESDPQVGALTSGAVPVYNGTQLVDSSIREVNGKVGIGTATPSSLLTVSTLARFGAAFATDTSKSCTMGGTNWTNSPPSAGACTTYCTSRGFEGGVVVPTGKKNCGGAFCDYISDFETCTTERMQNNGNCNSCATSFVCTCTNPGTELTGEVRVMSGNVGIGVAEPNSPLQVNGYLQLGTTAGAPPAADCDAANERGRMLTDPADGRLWVCANSGWVSK